MFYVLFDLEFNQSYDEKVTTPKIPSCPFEILQIGAYKLDETLNEVSTFNHLVKPSLYTEIHPYIQELTNIKEEDLIGAKPFQEVLDTFSSFIGNEDTTFCVWGMGDIKELFRNIIYHNLQEHFNLKKYINVQKYASRHFQLPKGQNISLRNAIEFLGIPLNKPLHDAVNDAYYTAEIFKRLDIHTVKPKYYDSSQFNHNQQNRKSKMIIDSISLINQFEKMYNRKITEEEKEIILLAYKMGYTHQFQIILKK